MSVFDGYARYYDLLYRDKDYAGEARHVHDIIQRHASGARSILELGCGTATHAIHLAAMGYAIHGVDRSHEMLAAATNGIQKAGPETASLIRLTEGDIRQVRLNDRFDVVIALFHVISYLPTNDDLKAAFKTAQTHLKPGGIFLFDCWYGPAVLSNPPVVRVKRMEDDETSVVRIAEPVMHPNENLVDVSYHVFIREKSLGQFEVLQETHRMRYLFKPEVEILLGNCGFRLAEFCEWMVGKDPGFSTWNVYFVAKTSL
jgi:SAM-dependent methyltransferase